MGTQKRLTKHEAMRRFESSVPLSCFVDFLESNMDIAPAGLVVGVTD
jgi:hypothetical protein